MKKVLLSACVAMGLVASAQPVISVAVTSPANGSTIVAGTQFAYGVTITNTGNMAHAGFPGDTIIYAPLVNGSFLNNGQGSAVAWYMADPIPAGGNVAKSQNLNLSGGQSGPLEFCAVVISKGTSYTVSKSDTGSVCGTTTYNAMGFGDFQLMETFDNSFYNNGTYFVQVSSANNLVNPELTIVDISGRIVKNVKLTANGGEINETVNVEDLNTGMYIVRLSTVKGLISNVKFVK